MDPETVWELFRYNTWANQRVLDSVGRLDHAQFTVALAGSYPSLRETLTHILWAEWLWLERWQGGSPNRIYTAEEFPDLPSLRRRWSQVQAGQQEFLHSVKQEQLQTLTRYTNLKGEAWEYPLWRQIFHLFSHSTYHRGQVTTLLRLLDVEPQTTDFLNFCDART